MKHTCYHCGMGFEIVDRFSPRTEVTRCAEKRCRMRMGSSKGPGPVRCYVERVDLPPEMDDNAAVG